MKNAQSEMTEIEIRILCLQEALETGNKLIEAGYIQNIQNDAILETAQKFYDWVTTTTKSNKLVMERTERH